MGTSISQIITVTTPPLGVAPGMATSLSISNLTATTLSFLWGPPATGSTPFSYQPQIAPAGSSTFAPIGGVINSTRVEVGGLDPNATYQFRVVTTNSTGTSTSDPIQATTLAVAPTAPTGLAVVGSPTQSTIVLQWVAPITGTGPLTYQVLYRTPSGSGSFLPFTTTTTALTQAITGLTAGVGYDFEVSAANSSGTSPLSAVLSNVQTAGGVAGNPPSPATGLVVSSIATTSLTLSWTAPTSGSTPFIYQPQIAPAGSSPTWTNIGGTTTLSTTVNATGLTPNTAYQFQVVTSNSSTTTSISAAISATTLSVLPVAPSGLTVLGSPAQTSITLQWSAPATGTGPFTYQVFVATPTGSTSFTAAAATTTALSQTITGLSPGTSYDFQINASNLAGTSPVSTTLVNTVTAAGSIGNAPAPATSLVVSNLAATTLTLSWTAPVSGTQPFTYQVQQAPVGSSSFSNIGGTTSNPTQSITGLTANTAYQFQVVTTNGVGTSTSATVSTTTLAIVPGAPTGLALVGTPAQVSVVLQWVAPTTGTGPFTYQVLSRSPSGTGTFTSAGSSTTALTQTITGLISGSTYDFEVVASNAAGTGTVSSALTNIQTASGTGAVAPSAPTNLVAGTVTANSIQLSWNAPAVGTPPLSYIVQYRVH